VGFVWERGSDHWCLHWVVFSLTPPRATTSHKCFFSPLENPAYLGSPFPNLRLKGPQVGHKLTKGGRQRNDRIRISDFFLFFFFFSFFFGWGEDVGVLSSHHVFFFLPNCVLTKFPIMLPLCSSSSHKFYKLFPIAPNFIPYPFPNFSYLCNLHR
jgi:hypothetical protein